MTSLQLAILSIGESKELEQKQIETCGALEGALHFVGGPGEFRGGVRTRQVPMESYQKHWQECRQQVRFFTIPS